MCNLSVNYHTAAHDSKADVKISILITGLQYKINTDAHPVVRYKSLQTIIFSELSQQNHITNFIRI